MSSLPRVTVIVPAYNEEKLIASVIDDLKLFQDQFDLEIIAIEGGSRDRTTEVAREHGASVISLPFKRGKGADLWTAMQQATGEYILQIDADHQFQPAQLAQMVELLQTKADVVLGTRFRPGASCEPGSVHILNLFGNWFLSWMVTLATGQRITDTMAGYKGLRRSVIPFLQLRTPHFGYEAEWAIRSKRAGFRIVEMPVIYTRRDVGVSNVRRLLDGFRVLWSIIRARLTTLRAQVGRCPVCTGVAEWTRHPRYRCEATCAWCGLSFPAEDAGWGYTDKASQKIFLEAAMPKLSAMLPAQGQALMLMPGEETAEHRIAQVAEKSLSSLIVCDVIGQVKDPVSFFHACQKALQPQGELIIIFPRDDAPLSFSQPSIVRLLQIVGLGDSSSALESFFGRRSIVRIKIR